MAFLTSTPEISEAPPLSYLRGGASLIELKGGRAAGGLVGLALVVVLLHIIDEGTIN